MKKYLFIMILLTSTIVAKGFPSWYYEIKDVKIKKAKFIEILKPMIEFANTQIEKDKKFIREFFSNDFLLNFNNKTTQERKIKLLKIANKYGIDKLYDREEFFKRIDTVPISLAIAQAAIESAWGSSRFTKIANNIFGQWTFKGKGVVPKKRDNGKKHKIKIFDSLQDSITGYLLNLNTHFAYKEFRDLRYKTKLQNKKFDGLIASNSLIRYSETREKYVKLLKSVIKKNNLIIYDKTI